MSSRELHCGFVPLADCASLVIAKEIGFAAEENIDLILHRAPTWSLLRDKLTVGAVDAAVTLSPMPIAASLGLGGVAERIDVLSVASVNGNVIGLSRSLHDKVATQLPAFGFPTPQVLADALASVVSTPIRLGVPFPFSMHKELVLYWLTNCGFDVEEKLDIRTIAPPMMAQAIENGEVDAFCVGEPWGSVTVERTGATIVLPGSDIWTLAPEKVIAARYRWIADNHDKAGALFRATWRAAQWIGRPENHIAVSEILARPDYVNVSTDIIDRVLAGRIARDAHGSELSVPRFIGFFEAQARFPWRSQAVWIAERLAARHNLDLPRARRIARDCFRTDLYREFIAPLGEDAPGASEKVEGMLTEPTPVGSAKGEIVLGPDVFFDGGTFDPGPN